MTVEWPSSKEKGKDLTQSYVKAPTPTNPAKSKVTRKHATKHKL